MKIKNKLISALIISAALTSLLSLSASASAPSEEYTAVESRAVIGQFSRYELAVSKVYNKNPSAYERVSLYRGGKRLSASAFMINGTPYLDVEAFFEELTDMRVTYDASKKILSVKGSGFDMEVIDGGNVVYANGRCLFSMTPSVLLSNGRMYAPISPILKAVGMSYSGGGDVTLYGEVKPIMHASRFYREDEVYWLSRIISAESRGESLLGQITVGTVVMNRVSSSLYPNTIWSVIFDKKYGVQFSPILDGSIYAEPTAASVVAAKITLEGFRVNSDALFFLYPRYSTSSWIPNNRQYLFSVGKHDFYA